MKKCLEIYEIILGDCRLADCNLLWWLLQLTSDSCLSGSVSIPLWSRMCWGASVSMSTLACVLGFSFSHFANPLFFPALPWNLDFILGKVWDPESLQPCSCHSGSVCVAWLVVARCSRTEIFREEPVTRVIALLSRSWCSAATLGNSNTSSWTERKKSGIIYFKYSSRSLQKDILSLGQGERRKRFKGSENRSWLFWEICASLLVVKSISGPGLDMPLYITAWWLAGVFVQAARGCMEEKQQHHFAEESSEGGCSLFQIAPYTKQWCN